MAARASREVLNVILNGRVVGRLERDGPFEYDKAWLDWDKSIPVCSSLPLREGTYDGYKLLAAFDNLLPDSPLVRRMIVERSGLDVESTQPFDMLKGLGRDCIGALQFLPEEVAPSIPAPPTGRPIAFDQIASRVRSLSQRPLALSSDERDFRISVAGAQNKTALLFFEGEWMVPDGTTPSTHILKPQMGKVWFDGGYVDYSASVQNEHLAMLICRSLGLKVAETEVLRLEEDLLVLSVKRFDREFDSMGNLWRIPQQDFCQALGLMLNRKYEANGGPGIGKCLDFLSTGERARQDRRQFMMAQLAFWLIGANDGHAKNFSTFLTSAGVRLTPLYDITSAQWQRSQNQLKAESFNLAMSVGKSRHRRFDDVLPKHFMQTAEEVKFDVKDLRGIMIALVTALPGAIEAAEAEAERIDSASVRMVEAIDIAARKRAALIEALLNERIS